MKKILITGGSGFVGDKLIIALLQQDSNNKITVCDKEFPELSCPVKYVICDISEVDDFHKYDVIYHLAGVSSIADGFIDPLKTHQTNVVSTIQILESIKNTNTVFVLASSCTVYNKFHSPYSLSKLVAEQYCHMYRNLHNTKTHCVRISNVYGEFAKKGVVSILLSQHMGKEPLTITGDGQQKRDFIHVSDVCSGLIAVSQSPLLDCDQVYDISTSKLTSINEIAKILGKEKSIEYTPQRIGDDFNCPLMINWPPNWRPTKNFNDYLKEFISLG